MNLRGDKMALFDITSEDDLLIDSQLDRASFDLRLSTAFDEHPRASRQSLAWDTAFFTSAGILDLRELSLVNGGFKNPEDQRSKICEQPPKLARGGQQATESFLEYRVSGKHKLQTTRQANAIGEHTPNISLASRTRMKIGNQQSSAASQMYAQKQEHRLPPCLKPPKLQTRTTGHGLSAANAKTASPRSAFPKNVSSAYTGLASGKRWLSKSLELKGDNNKNMGGRLHLNRNDSPNRWVSGDSNVAQVSGLEGNRNPLHHANSRSEAGNKVQLPSSMKQNAAKAKRSASPLPGDVNAINSSKKASRPCVSSQRSRIFEADQPAARSAKRAPLLRGISPEPRGRGIVKDCGGLKRAEMAQSTNSHSLIKKARSVNKDDEKENMYCAKIESIPSGLSKEVYVDFTNLFGGLGMEETGIKRKKASTSRLLGSAPSLRRKAKQSNKVTAVDEAGTKTPLGGRSSASRDSR